GCRSAAPPGSWPRPRRSAPPARLVAAPSSPTSDASEPLIADEDPHPTWRHVDRVADLEPKLLVAIGREIDGQHQPEVLGVGTHLHDASRRIDVRDLGVDARPAITGAQDVELVRANEGRRGARLVVWMLGIGDLEPAEHRPTPTHVTVKHVHVAEEVHDERVRRVFEDLPWRADLLDVATVHDGDDV